MEASETAMVLITNRIPWRGGEWPLLNSMAEGKLSGPLEVWHNRPIEKLDLIENNVGLLIES